MKLDLRKKQREQQLVEDFFNVCPDFNGWQFDRFSENPDLIYRQGAEELGFESIIVSEDQRAVDCYFDSDQCQLSVRQLGDDPQLMKLATEVLIRNLFKHIRRYSMPTVLVFSVMDERVDLTELAEHFVLPEFESYNIRDYYLANKNTVMKVSESKRID